MCLCVALVQGGVRVCACASDGHAERSGGQDDAALVPQAEQPVAAAQVPAGLAV